MPNPRSKSTATKENALAPNERDALLAVRQDARLGTNRGDGWWHITPIWYIWEGGCFRHTLGAGRRHLRNLRRDPHATVCVDQDPRLAEGLEAGAQAAVGFGLAELSTDEDLIREVTEQILVRYLGPEATAYLDPIMAEGRTIVTIRPEHWLTWDYNKD
jgi:PPOX class probable F420-dependent enzyme